MHAGSRGTYGAPRVHAELRLAHGIRCGRKRVARLMRTARLVGVHRRRLRGTTRRNGARSAHPDRVQRAFRPEAPNRLGVADLSQHPTGEGWLYHAVILDACSRLVGGWAMGRRATAERVVDALNMAGWRRRPAQGELIHHSDHGSQYTSLVFTRRLEETGILGSMGSVGDALDHAVAERFFATLETELVGRQVWASRQALKTAIFEDTEALYNRRRRHSTLGYLSPVEYERRWAETQPIVEAAD